MDQPVEFFPQEVFTVNGRYVMTGRSPVASTQIDGKDLIGQTWIVIGTPRVVDAIEKFAVFRPIGVGDPIGVRFEDM